MTDLTIINPTSNSFPIGTGLNQPIEIGVITVGNPTIGNGTLTEFISNAISANGSYSFDVLGVSGSGNWNVQISENSDSSWLVQLVMTGTFGGNSFTLSNAVATTNGNSITFTDPANPSASLTLSQNNGSWFTMGKININETALPVATLYVSMA